MSILKLNTFIFLVIYSLSAYAQQGVKGVILDEVGNPLKNASITVKIEENKGVITNNDGSFNLDLPLGNHIIKIDFIGYKTHLKKIKVIKNEYVSIKIKLEDPVNSLETILIQGKSKTEKKRETGYTIAILETKELKNSTTDLNQIIKSTAGINIREVGGLGSGFKLSLNGLSGNQIRYFIDGMPMENFGSALSLNNFPVNLVEKIEVYKGVVPISLGADALGGAVNLVSGYQQKTYLDASYSYGSFNTHRAAVNSKFTQKEKGFYFKLTSFYNHSNNDYLMKNVPVFDLELGNRKRSIDIKRFNDQYTSAMLSAQVGIFNKKYAKEWSFRFTLAGNKNNYQHPDNNILRPFGEFFTKNNTLLFSSNYSNDFRKFRVKAYTLFGQITETINDNSNRKYNWTGNFIERKPNDTNGELGTSRSVFELTDRILRNQLNVTYSITDLQNIEVNYSQNYLIRKGKDEVNILNTSFNIPNNLEKHIVGLAYNFKSVNRKFELSPFGKQYYFSGAIKSTDVPNTNLSFSKTGYGIVFSYHPLQYLTLKSSYEKAYRIPESYEVLGDGLFIQPNTKINPETSDNYNLGYRFNKDLGGFKVQQETNLFYRVSKDFIRFKPLGPIGEYENLVNVTSKGIEASIKTSYKNIIELQFNTTYQNLTDQSEFDEGLPNANFKSKLPNIPYLFWNTRLGTNLLKNKMHIFWNTRYVNEFFLTWENAGNVEDKNIIPEQLVHGFDIDYTLKNSKYNISATINNITDELVFDNFNIQKPGRAFYLKFRYFLNKK